MVMVFYLLFGVCVEEKAVGQFARALKQLLGPHHARMGVSRHVHVGPTLTSRFEWYQGLPWFRGSPHRGIRSG